MHAICVCRRVRNLRAGAFFAGVRLLCSHPLALAASGRIAGESELLDWLANVSEPTFDVSQPDVLAFCARHRQNIVAAIAASRRRGATLRPPGATVFDDNELDGADEIKALHAVMALEARRQARDGNASDSWECLSCMRRLQQHASMQGGLVWALVEKHLEHCRLAVAEAILFEPAINAGVFPFALPEDRFSHLPASADAGCLHTAQTLELRCASDSGELDTDTRWFSLEEQRVMKWAWPALALYRVYRRVFVVADGLATLPSDLEKYRLLARKLPSEQSDIESAWMRELVDPPTSELAAWAWPAPTAMYTTAIRADTDRRLTAVGIASAGFLAQHGSYPSSASDLVPDFLAEIPLDPWDGQPMRMRGLDDGLVVYSVGWNGVDDGGVDDRDEPFWSPDQAFCLGSAFRQRRLKPAAAR